MGGYSSHSQSGSYICFRAFDSAILGGNMKRQIVIAALLFSFFTSVTVYENCLAADYFDRKSIRVIVGDEVGTGYDPLTRLLAKQLPNHIPGKPNILVENMPGAQTIISANYLFHTAKPNGLTIGALNRGIPFAQLMKSKGVRFDVRKFSWLGSVASETTILALSSDFPYNNPDGLKGFQEPLNLAVVGTSASATQFALLLKEFAGFNLKITTYPSSEASMLAIERGEADGSVDSYASIKAYIERGLMRPVVRSRVIDPEIENVPVNEGLTTSVLGKRLMAMLAAADQISRPYVAPPGTPMALMTFLREAFAKMAKDPKVKEEAKNIMVTVDYTSPDEAVKTMSYLLSQPQDVVMEFGKYVKFYTDSHN